MDSDACALILISEWTSCERVLIMAQYAFTCMDNITLVELRDMCVYRQITYIYVSNVIFPARRSSSNRTYIRIRTCLHVIQ